MVEDKGERDFSARPTAFEIFLLCVGGLCMLVAGLVTLFEPKAQEQPPPMYHAEE